VAGEIQIDIYIPACMITVHACFLENKFPRNWIHHPVLL